MEEGNLLPAGETGHVYFEGGPRFEYYKDPLKTADAYDEQLLPGLRCVIALLSPGSGDAHGEIFPQALPGPLVDPL